MEEEITERREEAVPVDGDVMGQARAWRAVCNLIRELEAESDVGRTGQDRVLSAIREMHRARESALEDLAARTKLYLSPPAAAEGRATVEGGWSLRRAVEMAASWFREYEAIHRNKGADAKADRNRDRAEFMESALRSSRLADRLDASLVYDELTRAMAEPGPGVTVSMEAAVALATIIEDRAALTTTSPETTEGEAPLRAELNQIARNWETMETTFAAYRFCAEEIREALNRTAKGMGE